MPLVLLSVFAANPSVVSGAEAEAPPTLAELLREHHQRRTSTPLADGVEQGRVTGAQEKSPPSIPTLDTTIGGGVSVQCTVPYFELGNSDFDYHYYQWDYLRSWSQPSTVPRTEFRKVGLVNRLQSEIGLTTSYTGQGEIIGAQDIGYGFQVTTTDPTLTGSYRWKITLDYTTKGDSHSDAASFASPLPKFPPLPAQDANGDTDGLVAPLYLNTGRGSVDEIGGYRHSLTGAHSSSDLFGDVDNNSEDRGMRAEFVVDFRFHETVGFLWEIFDHYSRTDVQPYSGGRASAFSDFIDNDLSYGFTAPYIKVESLDGFQFAC